MQKKKKTALKKVNLQLDLLRKINFIYGASGLFIMIQFGASHSWQSFLEGWFVSVVNFELLKRIGLLLFPQQPNNLRLYVLLIAKFIFWGLVIAFVVLAKGIQPIPFMIGTLTILIAGIGWGLREFFIDART